MEVRELRIGNLVQDNKGNTIEVDASLFVADMDPNGYFDLSDCLPIQITPEWLEKLGFIRSDKTYSYQTSDQFYIDWTMEDGICLNGIYDDIMSNGDKLEHIKYIHQLQNLYYALTGDELILKP